MHATIFSSVVSSVSCHGAVGQLSVHGAANEY